MLWVFLRRKLIFLGNEKGPFSGTVEFLLQSSKKIYIIVMSLESSYWVRMESR